MADPFTIGGAIYSKLAADSTLVTALGGTAIWEGVAPETSELPYVIFHLQGGGDTNLYATRSLDTYWTVRAVAAELSEAKTIAGRVDAVLNGATLSPTGWTNFWTAAADEVSYEESDEAGDSVYHRGFTYRIRVEAS